VVGAVGLLASPAAAQPGKERREERREERKERREEKKEDLKEKLEDKKDAVKENVEERREKRKDRRKDRREKLKERWGDLLEKGPVKAELARHGRRVARLNRMLVLAEEAKKDDAVKRIKELLEKENARHDGRMAKLKEKGGAE
jgi:hypothetical protein